MSRSYDSPKDHGQHARKRERSFTIDQINELIEGCGFREDSKMCMPDLVLSEVLQSELEAALTRYRACAQTDYFPHLHMNVQERKSRMQRLQKDPEVLEEYPEHWTAEEYGAVRTGDYLIKPRKKQPCLDFLTEDLYALYLDGTGRKDKGYGQEGFLLLVKIVRDILGFQSDEDHHEAAIKQVQRMRKRTQN